MARKLTPREKSARAQFKGTTLEENLHWTLAKVSKHEFTSFKNFEECEKCLHYLYGKGIIPEPGVEVGKCSDFPGQYLLTPKKKTIKLIMENLLTDYGIEAY